MNCIIVDDDRFCRKILHDYIAQTDFLNLTGEYDRPVEALNALQKEDIDLVFLDIEMPEMTGMEMVKVLEERKPYIIMITSHTEFAIEAFEQNVTDYIVKPVSFPRFFKAINKVKEFHEQKSTSEKSDSSFFVKSEGALVKIHPNDILWIEAMENYMVFHTSKGKYTVHITMKNLEEKLSSSAFIRVHRSFIARLDKIDSIEDDEVIIGESRIPVSRTYKKELTNRIRLL